LDRGAAPEEWIEQINEACGYSPGWAIRSGQLLLLLRQQLPHGQWLAMWENRRMEIGLRTEEMLMRVAWYPVLLNSKHFSSLPASWSILYELSQLPVGVVAHLGSRPHRTLGCAGVS
jgi:hypothetical protein